MKAKYASRIEAIRLPVSRGVAAVMMGSLLFAVPPEIPGSMIDLLRALGLALAGVGAFGRLWCSVYIGGRKTHELVTDGPYALCRNPLYLFSLVGAVGVAVAAHSLSILLLVAGFFALYYPGVIRSEEMKLQASHGLAFSHYCHATPVFWPQRKTALKETPRMVDVHLFRVHMAEAIWFILAIVFVVVLDVLHRQGLLPAFFTLY